MKLSFVLLFVGLLISCSPPVSRSAFLAENAGKITQDEILKVWGTPESRKPLDDGRSLWVYKRLTEGRAPSVSIPPPTIASQGGGLGGLFPSGGRPELVPGTPATCRQYTLTFDPLGILRDHTESNC